MRAFELDAGGLGRAGGAVLFFAVPASLCFVVSVETAFWGDGGVWVPGWAAMGLGSLASGIAELGTPTLRVERVAKLSMQVLTIAAMSWTAVWLFLQ